MGKKSRAQNRAKVPVAAPPVAPAQTAEQIEATRQKQLKQMRFSSFMSKRPTPTHWQPCIQYLGMLEKVAAVRNTDDTLKTLTDEQIVHGLVTENLITYSVRNPGTGELLTMYSARKAYAAPRYPIMPAQDAEYKLYAELGKQQYLKRFRPLFEPGVLVNGRLNIPAYFGALEQIRANDVAEEAQREARKLVGASGKDIAAAIASGEVRPGDRALGEHEHDHGNGLVQVETKKEAVLMSGSNVGKSVPLSELAEALEARSEEIPAVWSEVAGVPEAFPPGDGTGATKGLYGDDPEPDQARGAGSLTVEVDEDNNVVDVYRTSAQEEPSRGDPLPQ